MPIVALIVVLGIIGWFMYFNERKEVPKLSELEKKLGNKLDVRNTLDKDIEALQHLIDVNKDIESKNKKAELLKEELSKQDRKE